MSHDHRLAASAALAWAAVAWWTTQSSAWVVGSALGLVALAALLRRPDVVLPVVLLTALAASVAWRLAANEASPLRAQAEQRDLVAVDAQLIRDARDVGHSLVADLSTPGGRVTAFLPQDLAEARQLSAGSHWFMNLRLRPPDSTDDVATATAIALRPAGEPAWWWTAADHVRGGIRDASRHGPADGGALVPALTVGDDAAIGPSLDHDFRRSGLTHLLAVSGTNLTIVLGAVLLAGAACGVGRRGRVWLGAAAIVGFIVLARPEPSVLRAAAMGAVGLLAFGIGRRGGVRALCVAVLALLFVDPWLARSAGFALSVCATGGIIVLAPPLADRLWWLPRWLALAIAVPVAAQLACTPTLVALSGEVSVVAVLANLLVAPAVAPATVLGLLGGLLELLPWIGDLLGALVGGAAAWCAEWIAVVGHRGGGMAGAGIEWPGAWWWVIPLLPLVTWTGWKVARRPAAVLGLTAGLALMAWSPPTPGWPPDGWVMVACDVGQGDATVLALDDPDEAVVIDTGPDDAAVHACLQRLRIDRIRLFVITHGDADHAAGWRGVARGRDVDQALIGPGGGRAPPGVPVYEAVAGERFTLGPLAVETIWPPPSAPFDATNDLGVVLRVTTHGVRLLLTADLGADSERAVLRSGADLSTDVLKFPHHGSKDQDERFLVASGARIATISAGEDNDHGHPAPEALAMLRDAGIAWVRTDQSGDIAIVVEDGRLRVVTRDGT